MPDLFVEIYLNATNLARANRQTVGEDNDYFITIAQLERILMTFKQ